MLYFVLLVFAFVLCVIEGFYPTWPRPRPGWIGLACYFAALLFAHGGLH